MSSSTVKPSGLPNIYFDALTPAMFKEWTTSSGSQEAWTQNVRTTLWILYQVTGSRTGPIILNAIMRSARRCILMPISKALDNAFASPDKPEDATSPGQQVRDGDGQVVPNMAPGTGHGSDFHLPFDPMDSWDSFGPGQWADETLLHELVHGVRMERGLLNGLPFNRGKHQHYGTTEEFNAIVITNIYRSELKREGLRADHGPRTTSLQPPLTDAATFATTYATELDKLIDDMWLLCLHLGSIKCHFNPIRRRLLARGFTPATLSFLSGIDDYGESIADVVNGISLPRPVDPLGRIFY